MPQLPRITPIRLARLPEPFDHSDWLFELKWDGFRALAYIESGGCRLVSRNDNIFKSFATLRSAVADALGGHDVILDGEIVALDAAGRADFYSLLYCRADPYFCAFDCLWLDGRDLRGLALVERKRVLRSLVPGQPSRLLYVDHIGGRGVDLFREVCRQDLEGIVAKRRDGIYDPEAPTWVKIKNRDYSQAAGRHEYFARGRREASDAAPRTLPWDSPGASRPSSPRCTGPTPPTVPGTPRTPAGLPHQRERC